MTYRDATPWGPVGRVVHGPFPVRLGRLAIGLLAIVAAPLFVVMAFDDARLDCDRKGDVCRYKSSKLVARTETFRLSQLRGVKVDIEFGSKNTRYGVPRLDVAGRDLRLARVSVDEAQRFARELERALADQRAVHLDLEATRAFALPGAFFLVVAVSALLGALRGIGRVVMVARDGSLELTRRVLGVPVWRGAVDLRGVTDVEVAWEHRKSFWTAKFSPGDTYGSLELLRGDDREPLTPAAFPGFHLHRRAERELRDLLGLPPRTPAREEALAASAKGYAAPPPFGGGVGGAIALTWIGLCCGALFSLPLAFLVLFPLGLAGRSPSDGVFMFGVPAGAALGVATAFYLRNRAASR